MKTTLHPTKNDLSKKIRRSMVDLLNQQLVDVIDLGRQAKQAHWNVKGPHFIGLHELFDEVAKEAGEFADEIAERAVALGGVALGAVQDVARETQLAPYPRDAVTGREHVEALSTALARCGRSVRAAVDTSARAGDADTSDLLTGISRDIDKKLWMVEAHVLARE
jgi:starvation-inducible DNA-binding protein